LQRLLCLPYSQMQPPLQTLQVLRTCWWRQILPPLHGTQRVNLLPYWHFVEGWKNCGHHRHESRTRSKWYLYLHAGVRVPKDAP
jgi:hypothetical protein